MADIDIQTYNQNNYYGTRQGRPGDQNMDYYMTQRRYQGASSNYDTYETMRNYMKETLRDTTESSDGPLMEDSIMPSPRRNLGQNQLNLREGGMWAASDPRIYEGSYYFDFMDPDDRAWTNDPRYDNMRKINENRFQSMPFLDELSMSSIGPQDPYDRLEKVRWWIQFLRSTNTNFQDSLTQYSMGYEVPHFNRALNEMIAYQLMGTPEHSLYHESNVRMSNDLTYGAGYRSIPDHRVPTARYGIPAGLAPFMDHKSSVSLYQGDNIFKDTCMMNNLKYKFRDLSEIRSLLDKFINESMKDSKLISNPKNVQLTSQILSSLGLTHTDLIDHTFQTSPTTSKSLFDKNTGKPLPQISQQGRSLIEYIMKMPDSEKLSLNKLLHNQISTIASTKNTDVQLTNDLLTILSSKQKLPDEIKNRLRLSISKLDSDVLTNVANKRPELSQVINNTRLNSSTALTPRDSKSVQNYSTLVFPTDPLTSVSNDIHDINNSFHDTTEHLTQLTQSLFQHTTPVSEGAGLFNQHQNDNHVFNRRELPNISINRKNNNQSFDHKMGNMN